MSVVAEGAETAEDWATALAAGVDLVQGYFIAKPMPADSIPAWLAGWYGKAGAGPHPLFQAKAPGDSRRGR